MRLKLDRIKNKLLSVTVSFDSFCSAYVCTLLFFFVPYFVSRLGAVPLAFLPLIFIVPFAALPLLYVLIHRFSPLIFGRYHLIMPLSAILCAVFFVLAFSANDGGDIALVFSGLVLFLVSLVAYRYCSFSVAARLSGKSIAKLRTEEAVFGAIGMALCFLSIYSFYKYNPDTLFLNSAYLCGALCLITALIQYLATVSETPRLSGKRLRSVKSVFRTFFVGLEKRVFLSSMFFTASFIGVAGLLAYYIFALGLAAHVAVIATAVVAASYGAGLIVASKLIRKRSVALSVAITVLLVVSSTLIAASVAFNDVVRIYCIMPCAALVGVGGALCTRQIYMRFLSIKPRLSSGIVFILIRLARCAAAGIALIPIAAACIAYGYFGAAALSYSFGAAGLFAIVGVALAQRAKPHTARLPELSYELNLEEFRLLTNAPEPEDGLITGSSPQQSEPFEVDDGDGDEKLALDDSVAENININE